MLPRLQCMCLLSLDRECNKQVTLFHEDRFIGYLKNTIRNIAHLCLSLYLDVARPYSLLRKVGLRQPALISQCP